MSRYYEAWFSPKVFGCFLMVVPELGDVTLYTHHKAISLFNWKRWR